jgi:hypothetical protein
LKDIEGSDLLYLPTGRKIRTDIKPILERYFKVHNENDNE